MIEQVPHNGEWKTTYDEQGYPEITWVRNTALLCWPVEWISKKPRPAVEGLHVTCAHIPDLMGTTKNKILDTLRSVERRQLGYQVVKVERSSAFGPDKNIPVLEVDLPNWWEYRDTVATLDAVGIVYSKDFDFVPHCTVDLPTVLDPPKKILIRPLELWFKDDEPEVI